MPSLSPSSIRRLVTALQATPLYRQYQQAFRKATGMTMRLRLPVDDDIPAANEQSDQNEFCLAMTASIHNCGACHASRDALKRGCAGDVASGRCFAHMSISALPVKAGETLIAYLWTGQVFTPGDREQGFGSIEKLLTRSGADAGEIAHLRALWEATPDVTTDRYESIVTLLRLFAAQLSATASGLLLKATPQEPEAIRRARHYVRDHLADRITLPEVALHAGLSPHHFSRVFKEASGLTLTDYINRSRIESARQLLLKADARVSEIAYEVGYQSLSQFNRSFLRITGRSPQDYRRQILRPTAGRLS